MVFVISPPFLPILVTSFYIGTEKVMYFSEFFPKQLNCPSDSSASILFKVINLARSFVKNYGN